MWLPLGWLDSSHSSWKLTFRIPTVKISTPSEMSLAANGRGSPPFDKPSVTRNTAFLASGRACCRTFCLRGEGRIERVNIHCSKQLNDQWFCGLIITNVYSTFLWRYMVERHVFCASKDQQEKLKWCAWRRSKKTTCTPKRKCGHSCDHIVNIIQNFRTALMLKQEAQGPSCSA